MVMVRRARSMTTTATAKVTVTVTVMVAAVCCASFPAIAGAGGASAAEPAASEAAVVTPTPAQLASSDGYTRLGGVDDTLRVQSGRPYIVVTTDAVALDAALAQIAGEPSVVWRDALFGFSASIDTADADALRSMPGVVSVDADEPVAVTADQPGAPWGLDRIDQRALPVTGTYTYTRTGAGVDAYVVDSGLWLSHHEFTGRVRQGAYWDYGNGTGPWDCNGHGTHVAGTLGGTTYGVAKGVTIVPVKTADCDGSSLNSVIITAIDWIIADHQAGRPAVANFSLGGTASTADLPMEAAVRSLIADGVTVVAAAGNDVVPTCNFSPARVPEAITVAASTPADDDADFSNYGPCNDIFAPGEGILSAFPSSDDMASAVKDGTSMAAPHVAGAAALVLQVSPSATPAEVWSVLDTASTKGALSECCNDPDKLLYVGELGDVPPVVPPAGRSLVSLVPGRLLDSRPGGVTVDGQFAGIGRRAAGSVTAIRVGGRHGVPGDASAVMLNVTAVGPGAPGYLTVFPCDQGQPLASHVNYGAGDVVPNAVLAKTSASGDVCVFTVAASDVLIDVTGFVPAGGSPVPVVPGRLLDSRPGGVTVDGQFAGIGRRAAGSVTAIRVGGRHGVPGDASAVMLNVTAVGPGAPGYLTVFPCDQGQPLASHVNYGAGDVVPNAVLAKTSASGDVCVFTVAASDVLIDVTGFVPAGGSPVPVVPGRLLDSRPGGVTVDGQFAGIGRRAAGSVTAIRVGGRHGVPGDASAVMLNVTAVGPGAPGYLTVFPCDQGQPLASHVNYGAGDVVPNAVLAKTSASGDVCVFTVAASDVLIDVTGYVPA